MNSDTTSRLANLKSLIRVWPVEDSAGNSWYASCVMGFEQEFGVCSGASNWDAGHAMELYLDDCNGSPEVLKAGFGDIHERILN